MGEFEHVAARTHVAKPVLDSAEHLVARRLRRQADKGAAAAEAGCQHFSSGERGLGLADAHRRLDEHQGRTLEHRRGTEDGELDVIRPEVEAGGKSLGGVGRSRGFPALPADRGQGCNSVLDSAGLVAGDEGAIQVGKEHFVAREPVGKHDEASEGEFSCTPEVETFPRREVLRRSRRTSDERREFPTR